MSQFCQFDKIMSQKKWDMCLIVIPVIIVFLFLIQFCVNNFFLNFVNLIKWQIIKKLEIMFDGDSGNNSI